MNKQERTLNLAQFALRPQRRTMWPSFVAWWKNSPLSGLLLMNPWSFRLHTEAHPQTLALKQDKRTCHYWSCFQTCLLFWYIPLFGMFYPNPNITHNNECVCVLPYLPYLSTCPLTFLNITLSGSCLWQRLAFIQTLRLYSIPAAFLLKCQLHPRPATMKRMESLSHYAGYALATLRRSSTCAFKDAQILKRLLKTTLQAICHM